MEKCNKNTVIFTFVLISVITINLFGCVNKTNKVESNNDQPSGTLVYNTKDAQNVKVKHGDSTSVALWYGGPNVLFDINYQTGNKTSFSATFGENSVLYPEAIFFYQNQKPEVSRAYHFNPLNGAVVIMSKTVGNDFDGPYYMFDDNGIIKVSGFYKQGHCAGIWRHYDSKGNILETIDANIQKLDVLKKFKVVL